MDGQMEGAFEVSKMIPATTARKLFDLLESLLNHVSLSDKDRFDLVSECLFVADKYIDKATKEIKT